MLATIEREAQAETPRFELHFPSRKISFHPLYSRPARLLLLTKADDFLRLPRELAALMQSERLGTIIGHDAPGAALAYFVSCRKGGFPYYATMYEPYADYMLEAGIWRRPALRYWVQ